MLFDAVIWHCYMYYNTKINYEHPDISLVFLNNSLVIGLHTCLFKFDKMADSKQSAQKDAHCNVLKKLPDISLGQHVLFHNYSNFC